MIPLAVVESLLEMSQLFSQKLDSLVLARFTFCFFLVDLDLDLDFGFRRYKRSSNPLVLLMFVLVPPSARYDCSFDNLWIGLIFVTKKVTVDHKVILKSVKVVACIFGTFYILDRAVSSLYTTSFFCCVRLFFFCKKGHTV